MVIPLHRALGILKTYLIIGLLVVMQFYIICKAYLLMNLDIKWVNLQRIPSVPVMDRRSNVFQSKNEWKYIKTSSKCERKWSFTRQEIV